MKKMDSLHIAEITIIIMTLMQNRLLVIVALKDCNPLPNNFTVPEL